MQFPRARRALCFSLLLLAACAREILPVDDLVSGDASEPDAEPVDPDPEDAAVGPADAEQTPADAMTSCPDGDRDGVCDAQDNCPSVSNPTQADSNKDGVGDACTMATACNPESIPASQRAGSATLSQVTVNGSGSAPNVKPGATLNVSVRYEFEECSIVETAQMRFVVNGVDGEGGNCQRQAAITCPLAGEGTAMFSVTAPSKAGVHYVVAKGVQGYTCSDSLNGALRIAAFCVQ